jgi:activating signal cointegrator 1
VNLTCLSIQQPFASAILTGQKAEECRSWRTSHRGPLAVHAGRRVRAEAFADYPNFSAGRVPTGRVLGVVDVVDCLEDVYAGWVWLLASPRWLKEPLPAKGRLGLFKIDVPDRLLPDGLLAPA